MRYLIFDEPQAQYEAAILVTDLNKNGIESHYLPHLDKRNVIAYSLHTTGKKTKKADRVEYLNELLPLLEEMQIKYLIVGDSEYFKALSGLTKVETSIGYVLDMGKPFQSYNFKLVYIPSHRQVFYDPDKVKARIQMGIQAYKDHSQGTYAPIGDDIVHFSEYPSCPDRIKWWLDSFLENNIPLTCDIEAFSLKHYSAGIGTISFAWSQNEGIAFPVDYGTTPEDRVKIRKLLLDFFISVKAKIIWHNASYDIYVLIYQLWMQHIEDTKGLLEGLEIMTRNFEDTKIIAYLATNTCAGNQLGLKPLSHEYSGNYSVDEIADITKIPLDELLRYNLIDTLSTWYVYNKYKPVMIHDNQLQIYQELFKPGIVDILQMQLTGMPVCMERVVEAKSVMDKEVDDIRAILDSSVLVQEFQHWRKEQWVIKKNSQLKVKRVTIDDCPVKEYYYNPGSNNQTAQFLHDTLGLPVVDLTDTGLPSTGAKSIKKLINRTSDPKILEIIDALVRYAEVSIILSTFIPALENSQKGPSGQYYLFGFFNLGGTVSGRLSSNGPNLQNIPARGSYAKAIKDCFIAAHPWLFAGMDFESLEDKISALTTKDPNKLSEYIEGFDGHCLRSYVYFSEQMPDIIEGDVNSINSIKVKYPELRQDSKDPTFALTYQGTPFTLMINCGFSQQKANTIFERYQGMYKVSIDYVNSKLDEASKTGYVIGAFGLRVRTPLLSQVIRGNSSTPTEAQGEGRTAGNALGQSYGLLNTRASVAFMAKVRKHPEYRYLIRPCAHIHDAQYYMIYDNLELIKWVNDNLIEEANWQDDPAIYHDIVKLGGELSVFYPSWNDEMIIKNNVSESEIEQTISKHLTKLEKQGVIV